VQAKRTALKQLIDEEVLLPIKNLYTRICVPKDESVQQKLNPFQDFQDCFLELSQGSQSGDDVKVEEENGVKDVWCGWGYCTTLSCRHDTADMEKRPVEEEKDDDEIVEGELVADGM
jgi:hypothetical protein